MMRIQHYQQKNFKYMLMLRPLVFLLFALFFYSAAVAANKKLPAKVQADTSKISVKKFNENALARLRADKDFNYYTDRQDAPSWWQSFCNWVWRGWRGLMHKLFGWIGKGSRYSLIFRIIEYTLIAASVALLIYAIFKSLGIDLVKLLKGKS